MAPGWGSSRQFVEAAPDLRENRSDIFLGDLFSACLSILERLKGRGSRKETEGFRL